MLPCGRRLRHAATALDTVTVTAPITGILEDYLGIPYPFDKLDSIAVPRTVAFGAMENPGLITYQRRAITALPRSRA